LAKVNAYLESGRAKEDLTFSLSHQYRPTGQPDEEWGETHIISSTEVFSDLVPVTSWFRLAFDGIIDGLFWYGDVWSIIMGCWMTYQLINHLGSFGYRCFALNRLFGWSTQMLTALCPDFLFFRTYRGMHEENERQRREVESEEEEDRKGKPILKRATTAPLLSRPVSDVSVPSFRPPVYADLRSDLAGLQRKASDWNEMENMKKKKKTKVCHRK
jgi:hypothetical protein